MSVFHIVLFVQREQQPGTFCVQQGQSAGFGGPMSEETLTECRAGYICRWDVFTFCIFFFFNAHACCGQVGQY